MFRLKILKLAKNQKGATAILISVVLLSIILAIALSVANIMVAQIRMAGEISNSIPAFYAADAAAEKCLFQIRKTKGVECDDSLVAKTVFTLDNGATAEGQKTLVNQIQSSGNFGGTKRSAELNW